MRLRRAAFLHDIGKVAVPSAVLCKPGPLTDAELDRIRLHPEVGGHMLEHAGLHEEARWVRHHHERVDGRGYPDGVCGDALALEARIIFVADAFEAMTSDRPYRRGMAVADAVDELRRCAGTQFDPRVVDALCDLLAADRLTVLALRDAAA
jgi:HD-GYP domain-containing protein (c-di-GMP phosphodiesterase class II)